MTKAAIGAALAVASASSAATVPPPAPYGPVPSARQLRWHALETYAFIHFSPNTFTNKEWGYGDEDPSVFNPTDFDADQIIGALKAAGMKGAILTAKHHDGFCLWPTKTTEHSIAKSTWRGGKGDVVRDISDACKRAGLKFGVYLSPWDRNNPKYATPEYIGIYRAQLSELLTNYGPLFEVWHDGANGGDGYYGGAREKRSIDPSTYYDWPNTWALMRKLQPNAVIFSDVGPDIRWVGNESGFANETCWETFEPKGPDGRAPAPGHAMYREGTSGHRDGSRWMPAECDVSIRPGWFWHAEQNGQVKTPRELLDLYYRSVGRGASFLLNLPPDNRGRAHENDVASLAECGRLVRETFRTNLAARATITASNVRGNDAAYAPANVVKKGKAYWATDDGVTTPELTVDLGKETTFNVVRVREQIALGQRIDAFALDAWQDGKWTAFAAGTSVGNCRLIRTAADITTTRVRLRITQAAACPCVSEFGLYVEAK